MFHYVVDWVDGVPTGAPKVLAAKLLEVDALGFCACQHDESVVTNLVDSASYDDAPSKLSGSVGRAHAIH